MDSPSLRFVGLVHKEAQSPAYCPMSQTSISLSLTCPNSSKIRVSYDLLLSLVCVCLIVLFCCQIPPLGLSGPSAACLTDLPAAYRCNITVLWTSSCRTKTYQHFGGDKKGFFFSLFSSLCLLNLRSLQGDLPCGPWIHLLTLWCADLCQTLGRRWCAEHRCVVGWAESRLPSHPILPPVAAIRAAATQLPSDTANTPVPGISRDTASGPGASHSTAAPPTCSRSQRVAWTTGRWGWKVAWW